MPRDKKPVSDPVALCCSNIHQQDNGIAGPIVDAEIQKAIDDLADRGEEDGKTRHVIIDLTFGLHNGLVYTNVAAYAKCPPRRSKNTGAKLRMKSKDHHEVLFQPDNAENPDQPTFVDPDEDHDE